MKNRRNFLAMIALGMIGTPAAAEGAKKMIGERVNLPNMSDADAGAAPGLYRRYDGQIMELYYDRQGWACWKAFYI